MPRQFWHFHLIYCLLSFPPSFKESYQPWIRTCSRCPSQDDKPWVMGEGTHVNKLCSSLHSPTWHPQDLCQVCSPGSCQCIIPRPRSPSGAWYFSSCTSASPGGLPWHLTPVIALGAMREHKGRSCRGQILSAEASASGLARRSCYLPEIRRLLLLMQSIRV